MLRAAARLALVHCGYGEPGCPAAFQRVGHAIGRGTGNIRPPLWARHPNAVALRSLVRGTRRKRRYFPCHISANPQARGHCPLTSKSSRLFRRGTFHRSGFRVDARQGHAQSFRIARRCRSNLSRTFRNRRQGQPNAWPSRPSTEASPYRQGSTA